jgi:hypothetical protein
MRIFGKLTEAGIVNKTPLIVLMVGSTERVEVIIPMAVLRQLEAQLYSDLDLRVDHVADDRYMLKVIMFTNPNPESGTENVEDQGLI